MMEDMERYYEIKKGTIPHHDNLLAVSKPEDELGLSFFFGGGAWGLANRCKV